MSQSLNKVALFPTQDGDNVVVVEEEGSLYVKQLKTEHLDSQGNSIEFDLMEESDGSIRLIDYLPVLEDVYNRDITYIIDEIERSIHPLLIKEVISKFSADTNTKGQLIFSTHESNLLDLSIFRQDEIWFVEKNHSQSTDLYSLSDFKEHNTLDIRKRYLAGRYGSIPFLANLSDLNWDKQLL